MSTCGRALWMRQKFVSQCAKKMCLGAPKIRVLHLARHKSQITHLRLLHTNTNEMWECSNCLNRNIHFKIWRDLFLQPDRPCFFQSLGEKNKKQKFITRNLGDRMGVSGYGSFFCTWAVRACPAQGRVFTEPWATPPTAGAMKIERGVVYDPTIHHWLC